MIFITLDKKIQINQVQNIALDITHFFSRSIYKNINMKTISDDDNCNKSINRNNYFGLLLQSTF